MVQEVSVCGGEGGGRYKVHSRRGSRLDSFRGAVAVAVAGVRRMPVGLWSPPPRPHPCLLSPYPLPALIHVM